MNSLTLDDIAVLAGVSRSTVSRVVNNQPNVKEKVRKHVLEVIAQKNFQPNAAARSLAMQRSATIGLILPQSVSGFFTDPYYPNLLKGIAKACNQHNYTLALFLVSTKEEEDTIFSRAGRRGFLDGVIIQSSHHGDQSILSGLIKAGMPLVVVGRPFQTENVTYLDVDNVQSAFKAVEHLIQTGCRKIATITGPLVSAVGIDRLDGYQNALHKHHLAIEPSLIVEGNFSEMGGYDGMKKLLPLQPDAVFVASDVMAFGAMHAIREAGLQIPQDISVIGFDDLPIAGTSSNLLSTVHQHVPLMGFTAVETLLELIDNPVTQTRRIILDTDLMLRETCRGLPAEI